MIAKFILLLVLTNLISGFSVWVYHNVKMDQSVSILNKQIEVLANQLQDANISPKFLPLQEN
jgi:hypothetical protein